MKRMVFAAFPCLVLLLSSRRAAGKWRQTWRHLLA